MKDAQKDFLDRLNTYRDDLDRLARSCESSYNYAEARACIESAIKLTDHIISIESILNAIDDEPIPEKKEDEKPS